MEVINLAMMYNRRPSELVGIEEPYEAFCFDEACAYIKLKVDDGDVPKFKRKYKSFNDLYKKYN